MTADTTIRRVTEADLEWCVPRLWAWMHEYPEANLDDSTAKTEEAFREDMRTRLYDGERIWTCAVGDEPVGMIGYRPISDDTGMLHGVCFASVVHGQGVAHEAMRQVLDVLKLEGVRKVSATYFTDNRRVRRFLEKCGFVDEGYLHQQTTRGYAHIDMHLVAQLLR